MSDVAAVDVKVVSETPKPSTAKSNSVIDTTSQAVSSTAEYAKSFFAEQPDAVKSASLKALFQFADTQDMVLLAIGMLLMTGMGALMGIMQVIFSSGIESLTSPCTLSVGNSMSDMAINLLIVAGVAIVLMGGGTTCIKICQTRQAAKYRIEYMRAIIRQDIGWFDVSNPQELSTAFGEALQMIETALGSQVFGIGCQQGGAVLSNIIVAFVVGDVPTTLICCLVVPIGATGMLMLIILMRTQQKEVDKAYASSGGVASEGLGAMRTVAYLGIEKLISEKYVSGLNTAMQVMKRGSLKLGIAEGLLQCSNSIIVGVGFLFGASRIVGERRDTTITFQTEAGLNLCSNGGPDGCGDHYDFRWLATTTIGNFTGVPLMSTDCGSSGTQPLELTCYTTCLISRDDTSLSAFGWSSASAFEAFVAGQGGVMSCGVNLGKILLATQCLMQVGFALGQINDAVTNLTKGRQALVGVDEVLQRKPTIDSFSEAGLKPEKVEGKISVKDVVFAYPAAPDFQICNGYSLEIEAGQRVALCGPSGSGKSTIIGLLLRFYDPSAGTIALDGVDLKELNVGWLRAQLGLVGQEPVLFVGTIAENIANGVQGEATREQIIEAAKIADADKFITEVLNDGYETQVGQGGGRLSGGQKQRIAIARAMIKKPKLLLLDEATSALDNAAEKAVQAALDKIQESVKRTTITIAHRLTTIANSDSIAVINKGVVVEKGTWDELMALNGIFFSLAERQAKAAKEDEELMRQNEPTDEAVLGVATAGAKKSRLKASVRKIMMMDSFIETVGEKVEVKKASKSPSTKSPQAAAVAAAKLNKMKTGIGDMGDMSTIVEAGTIETKPPGTMKKLMEFLEPGDRFFLVQGFVFSFIIGAATPLTFLGLCCMLFNMTILNPDMLWSAVSTWSIILICQGALVCASCSVEAQGYGTVGAHLTRNLRASVMNKLLTMHIGYFDMEENSAGELTEFLASKVATVQSLVTSSIGLMVRISMLFLVAVALMIAFGQPAMIGISVGSLFLLTGPGMGMYAYYNLPGGAGKEDKDPDEVEEAEEKPTKKNLLGLFAKKDAPKEEEKKKPPKKKDKSAGAIVGEVVLGIRTIASFNAERMFFRQYEQQICKKRAADTKASPTAGIVSGIGFSMVFCSMAVQYWSLGKLTEGGLVDPPDMTVCGNDVLGMMKPIFPIMAMMMVVMMATMMAMAGANAASGGTAAAELFKRLGEKSKIDPSSDAGTIVPEGLKGRVKVDDIVFAYPAAPDFPICKGYSLIIEAGMTCALAGPSGSGKSTIINLIERFYDPLFGYLAVDGYDVATLNIRWFRQQLGLVGQEPVLFAGTVAENIAMGKDGGASQEEIQAAAKAANAHDFITNDLAEGYTTQVGLRGGKLSGGQKQRVAIARALVRKPTIMLLDEATSALDNNSEKIVQAALDEIMAKQKKTTITIAHRLSTIRAADKIAIVNKGKIAEEGSHEELMVKKGIYFGLVQAQSGH